MVETFVRLRLYDAIIIFVSPPPRFTPVTTTKTCYAKRISFLIGFETILLEPAAVALWSFPPGRG